MAWVRGIERVMFFYVSVTVFIAVSCASDEPGGRGRIYGRQSEKVGEMALELDAESSSEIFLAQYLEKQGQEWLFTLNHLINAINIYTLPEGRLSRKVYVSREGPNGVRQIQGFLALSPDSLLVLPRGNLSGAILVDTGGTVLDGTPLEGAEWAGNTFINHVSNANCPPVYHNGRFYFVQYPMFDLFDPANISEQYEFSLVYDARDKKLNGGDIHFPPAYHRNTWSVWATLLGQAKGHDDWFVFNWPFSNDLFVTDFETEKWVDASVFPRPVLPRPFSGQPDLSAELQMMLENVAYRRLYYDPYRRLYYRFASLPISFSPREHRDYRAFDAQPLKVITLNQDFEIIAETKLPGGTYDIRACFVGRSGLYIPRIDNPDHRLDEDRLTYSIYRVSQMSE